MFTYQHVCFEGFGYVLPAHVVTSAQIERELAPVYERFGLHEGRLEPGDGERFPETGRHFLSGRGYWPANR